MSKRRSTIALALLVGLLLSACTVTVWPEGGSSRPVDVPRPVSPTAAIQRFESSWSSYRVGDPIAFRLRTDRPGYVTLTAFDPDGTTYVIARNVFVAGNRLEIIPAPAGRVAFVAAPPTGRHIVRAHFTPERTSETVTFAGIGTLDGWLTSILLEIRAYGFTGDDVAEVRFDIRR